MVLKREEVKKARVVRYCGSAEEGGGCLGAASELPRGSLGLGCVRVPQDTLARSHMFQSMGLVMERL